MNRLEREKGLNHPEFSYRYYREFLDFLTHNFQIVQGSDVVHGTEQDVVFRPRVFLRHDIDVSPVHALRMAKVEYEADVQSTYHVMVGSPLYSLDDPAVKESLMEIQAMGHEIGLHLDIGENIKNSAFSIEDLETKLQKDTLTLETIIQQPVRSFSFHRQGEKIPCSHDQLIVNGMVNTFSSEMGTISNGRYIADSRGAWSIDPVSELTQFSQTKALVQLVVHPIWWGETHRTAQACIQQWYTDATSGKSLEEAKEIEMHIHQTMPKFMRSVVLDRTP